MTNCGGMARQRTHITFCNGFRTTVFSAAAGLGADGKSAYDLAVEQGFTGTLAEWLESFIGADGADGKSAYELAVEQGFAGTLAEWLESL